MTKCINILIKSSRNFNAVFVIEKHVSVTSKEEIAKISKEYFYKIVPKLNIIQNDCYIPKTRNIEDPIKKASFKYH